MKRIYKLVVFSLVLFFAAIFVINFYIAKSDFNEEKGIYKVSINRIKSDVLLYEKEKGQVPRGIAELKAFSSEDYEGIISFEAYTDCKDDTFSDYDQKYVVYETDNAVYKICYDEGIVSKKKIVVFFNIVAIIMLVLTLIVILRVWQTIIVPFNKISDLPYELSKGNLTIPMKETKDRTFGKFLWGLDLLREHLEENKARELELQREKKLLLLSLSHDIKTPLSAIKLYAKALSRNLYSDEDKKNAIAGNIDTKVDEIEHYISEIVKASNDDFLSFEVDVKEVYSKGIFEQIRDYYAEKMKINQIDFSIGDYSNSIIRADEARAIEVIQNIVENAIKYGDGRRIWIENFYEDDEYTVIIRNTGCQLEDKDLPHVFDSFFRGSNVEKKNGSGLGLYICRELMHIMEGEIFARIATIDDESLPEEARRIMEITLCFRMA